MKKTTCFFVLAIATVTTIATLNVDLSISTHLRSNLMLSNLEALASNSETNPKDSTKNSWATSPWGNESEPVYTRGSVRREIEIPNTTGYWTFGGNVSYPEGAGVQINYNTGSKRIIVCCRDAQDPYNGCAYGYDDPDCSRY